MPHKRDDLKTVIFKLTPDQHSLAKRRLFVDEQTWQTVCSALMNAYICGDVTVTRHGRYSMHPPSGNRPVVEVPQTDGMVVEIEPEWGHNKSSLMDRRPAVGIDENPQENREAWGTRELCQWLRLETGRKVNLNQLRRLLSFLEIEKTGSNGKRWEFLGSKDERIIPVKECIEDGTYDALVRQGALDAKGMIQEKRRRQAEIEEYREREEQNRRERHLKKLRELER